MLKGHCTSYQFWRLSREVLTGLPMQANCCLRFQLGSSTSVRVCTISSATFLMFIMKSSNICITKTPRRQNRPAYFHWFLYWLGWHHYRSQIRHFPNMCCCVGLLTCLFWMIISAHFWHFSSTLARDWAKPKCCSIGRLFFMPSVTHWSL